MAPTQVSARVPAVFPVTGRWLAPPLPREHGAWAWLLLPLVVGGAAAGSANAPLLLLAAGSLAAYLARAPLEMAPRRPAQRRAYLAWAALYGVAALLTLAPLLLYYQRWGLLPLGAMGSAIALPVLLSRRLRYRWRAQGELLVVAGLSLLAPAAYHAAGGDLDGQAAALWLLPALYGAGSIFYVRMLFEHRRSDSPAGVSGDRHAAAFFLSILWITMGAGTLSGFIPPLTPVAFLPTTLKAALALARRTTVKSVRRTGVVEVLHAGLFAALLVVAYALE